MWSTSTFIFREKYTSFYERKGQPCGRNTSGVDGLLSTRFESVILTFFFAKITWPFMKGMQRAVKIKVPYSGVDGNLIEKEIIVKTMHEASIERLNCIEIYTMSRREISASCIQPLFFFFAKNSCLIMRNEQFRRFNYEKVILRHSYNDY